MDSPVDSVPVLLGRTFLSQVDVYIGCMSGSVSISRAGPRRQIPTYVDCYGTPVEDGNLEVIAYADGEDEPEFAPEMMMAEIKTLRTLVDDLTTQLEKMKGNDTRGKQDTETAHPSSQRKVHDLYFCESTTIAYPWMKPYFLKWTDPGKPKVDIKLYCYDWASAIFDTGTCVNIMPSEEYYSVLPIHDDPLFPDLEESDDQIRTADGVCHDVVGILRDFPIEIMGFDFVVDIYVMDMRDDADVILGRPFLANANAYIGCRNGSISIEKDDERKTLTYGIDEQGRKGKDVPLELLMKTDIQTELHTLRTENYNMRLHVEDLLEAHKLANQSRKRQQLTSTNSARFSMNVMSIVDRAPLSFLPRNPRLLCEDPGAVSFRMDLAPSLRVDALLDSGSSINCIPRSVLRKMKNNTHIAELVPHYGSILVGNSELVDVAGLLQKHPVKIQGVPFMIDFHIIDSPVATEVILGRPFLSQAHACVDYFRGIVSFMKHGQSHVFRMKSVDGLCHLEIADQPLDWYLPHGQLKKIPLKFIPPPPQPSMDDMADFEHSL